MSFPNGYYTHVDGSFQWEPIYENENSATRIVLFEKYSPPKLPELDLTFQSIDIQVEARPIRATWTIEMAQDLQAYHSIDAEVELSKMFKRETFVNENAATRIVLFEKYKFNAEQELISMLSFEISQEIDKEIMNTLLTLPKFEAPILGCNLDWLQTTSIDINDIKIPPT